MAAKNSRSKPKKQGNTVEVVWKLAEPIAKELGLSIWDVRFVKEGAYWYLRIFIDRPEGITLDECEAMSRAINDPLDRLDPIDQEYCLEVCSPGIDRELIRPEHFAAFLGAVVSVRLIRPLEDGRRELIAILHQYEDSILSLETEDGEHFEIPKKDTASVRICDEYVDVDELDEDTMEEFEEHE